MLFFLFTPLNAGEKENIVKGVVLERISQFISYEKSDKEFDICVYGNKDLKKVFKNLYKDRYYKGNRIKVEGVDNINDIYDCEILYTSNLSNDSMSEILLKIKEYTLLVTEDISYLYDGFMVAIYFENKKLKFAINQQSLIDAKLKVNYRLLNVASKVINPVKN